MPTNSKAEYMRNYRNSHPEYLARGNEKLKIKLQEKYKTDEEYRERKKKIALDYYYKTKKQTDDD